MVKKVMRSNKQNGSMVDDWNDNWCIEVKCFLPIISILNIFRVAMKLEVSDPCNGHVFQ